LTHSDNVSIASTEGQLESGVSSATGSCCELFRIGRGELMILNEDDDMIMGVEENVKPKNAMSIAHLLY
jgi:hypothetical protein